MTKSKKSGFTDKKKNINALKRNRIPFEGKKRKGKESLGKIKILKIKSESLNTSTVMSPTAQLQADFQHKIECSTCLVKFPPPVFEDHEKACFYYCPECTYKTKTIFGLNKHLGSHKDTHQVECEMCLTSFSQNSIKSHKETCSYWCPKCPYQTKTIFGLNNHLAIRNKSNVNLPKLEYESYSTSTDSNVLGIHEESFESLLRLECEICKFSTTTVDAFTLHVENHQIQEENVSKLKFEIGQFKETTKTALETHYDLNKDKQDKNIDFIQQISIPKKAVAPVYAKLDQFVSWQ